ncbi:MAG: alpha/beta hydrolase-fold protein [Anaerolineae bacterium]|nr:alpha/beta hydrolase-fold protein [Anaerolineae bacterium]
MLSYRLVLPDPPTAGAPVLVLLHGRGADETDMLGLARFWPDTLVVAVRAPYPATAWGYGPGFAWYRYLGGTRPDPEHFSHSLAALDAFLTALPTLLPVSPGPLFLGGFSQGGTVSLGYALAYPGRVHTVLNLSGFLAEHPAVQVTPETVATTRFYWPHGTLDPAVPLAVAQEGRRRLREAGAHLLAPDYEMGHAIIPAELNDIAGLLREARRNRSEWDVTGGIRHL